MVWKAVDKKTRDTVALKKIFDAFQNATDAQVGRPEEQQMLLCTLAVGTIKAICTSSRRLYNTKNSRLTICGLLAADVQGDHVLTGAH